MGMLATPQICERMNRVLSFVWLLIPECERTIERMRASGTHGLEEDELAEKQGEAIGRAGELARGFEGS